MGVLIGPFDPLQLVFNTLNLLLRKGTITYDEAREILKNSLDKTLPEEKKEEILNSLIRRT
jgi:hypothetical protein